MPACETPDVVGAQPGTIAARWAVCLSEPLLSLAQRQQLEADMARLVDDGEWGAHFCGGVLADLALSLPDNDPWRHLSGRLGELATPTPPPGPGPGAWAVSGRVFGVIDDAEDLLPPTFSDPLTDPALAALAPGLTPEPAALIAFATVDWQACGKACALLSGDLYDSFATAVRWLVHRRRTHLGVDTTGDTWPTESIYRWTQRATAITTGADWSPGQIDRLILAARILPYVF